MIRLFVALNIPKEIRSKITEFRKSLFLDEGRFRWEDNSKIHLTLKFIGEVKESLLEPIINELSFLEDLNKIGCTTQKFGFFFKSKDEPRILWLGLKLDDSVLTIVEELNNKLAKFSIPIEQRKFKTHLTLLRIKNKVSEDFIKTFLNAELLQMDFISNEIVLMKSELSSKESIYTEIKKYKLK